MNTFDSALSRFAARWRQGLLLVAVLMTLAMGWLVLLLLGVFDFVAPLSDAVRPVVFMGWCSVLVLLALNFLLPLIRLNRASAAAHADETLSERRPVITALEVSRQQQVEATPLRQFLIDKALWQGARELDALELPAMLPWRSIRRAVWFTVIVLVLFCGLCVLNEAAVKTIVARLLHPHADVPPYSPLQFEVTPARPKVVYGSDAELEVRVTGGAVPEGVVLLTREDATAPISTAGAFAMGGGRFGQRLQRVTQPVQIAFAAGAARSRWM